MIPRKARRERRLAARARKLAALQRQPQLPLPTQPTRSEQVRAIVKKLPSWGWSLVVAAATIASLVVLWPDVSLETSGTPIGPMNPFRNAFKMQNNGWIPLLDIEVECHINKITGRGDTSDTHAMLNGTTRLDAGESTTLFCSEENMSFYVSHPIQSADITLFTQSRPGWRWLPLYRKRQRFVTQSTGQGLVWLPAASKVPPHPTLDEVIQQWYKGAAPQRKPPTR